MVDILVEGLGALPRYVTILVGRRWQNSLLALDMRVRQRLLLHEAVLEVAAVLVVVHVVLIVTHIDAIVLVLDAKMILRQCHVRDRCARLLLIYELGDDVGAVLRIVSDTGRHCETLLNLQAHLLMFFFQFVHLLRQFFVQYLLLLQLRFLQVPVIFNILQLRFQILNLQILLLLVEHQILKVLLKFFHLTL